MATSATATAPVLRIEDGAGTGVASSVTKALRLLDVFAECGPVLGVSQLSRKAQLAKSTTFRLLSLLEEADLVERDGKGYRLTWRMFELGASVESRVTSGLKEAASPWMTEALVKSGGAPLHLAVREGADVLIVDKVYTPRSLRTDTAVGARLPLTCSALGKAMLSVGSGDDLKDVVELGLVRKTAYSIVEPGRLLADLQRARQAGFAVNREELQLGVACVAAPIRVGRQVVAAVSLSCSPAHAESANVARLAQWTAHQISSELGVSSERVLQAL